ncbi:hypothetical protein B0H13DRAFT_1864589 [Mycena leptocephala]|nr:hypothetical protein B0H13DRAFT_1864589 [Mycena leptocephala]
MTQICPFSTRNSPLARFVSKFIGLRELELGSVTWADAGGDVWPSLSLELEHLSILGFHQALDVLPWLSCAEYGPRTRGLALDIPNNADPASLRLVSIFLHRLDGHLHYLRLDVHPSYLQSCRGPSNQLDELVFDVDIMPDMRLSNSDYMLKNILANPAVKQIPAVQFQVLRGRQSCEAMAMHRRQFASFMRERGLIMGRNVVCCRIYLYEGLQMTDLSFRPQRKAKFSYCVGTQRYVVL